MAPDEFRQLGLPGIQPFMILTKGGATREVAEEIFTNLKEAGKSDSLAAAYTLASLAFGKENGIEQNWLLRRLSDMHDVLRDTPVYQEMTKWAREEERLQNLRSLRDLVISFVQARFPDSRMLQLAKSQVATIDDPKILEKLILKVGLAQTPEEVQRYLLDWRDSVEQED